MIKRNGQPYQPREHFEGKVMDNSNSGLKFFIIIFMVIFTLIGGGMYIFPIYGVWQQDLSGQAALARATQERQILVEASKAELESAQNYSDAIGILGQAAKDYPEYREQMFITGFAEALKNGTIDQIIYVPTEANIPIMEATRLIQP